MSFGILAREVVLTDTTCCNCGVVFALPDFLLAQRREDGQNFYCPNGHSLLYRETEAAKLRKQLDKEQARRSAAEDQARAAQAELRKVKRAAAGADRRTKAGVCPCCNRSFVQLRRHMAAKHPDELAAAGLAAQP